MSSEALRKRLEQIDKWQVVPKKRITHRQVKAMMKKAGEAYMFNWNLAQLIVEARRLVDAAERGGWG